LIRSWNCTTGECLHIISNIKRWH